MTESRPGGKRGSLRYEYAAWSAVILLAAGLRLCRINWQSAWYDEIFALYACGRPLGELTRIVVQDYAHPPLHYYLTYGWFAVFGYGVLQARMMSLCFGVLAVVFTGLAGRALFGRRAGLLAALLMSVSSFGVVYSHEARGYSQMLAFSTAAIYFFIKATRTHARLCWFLFVLCALGAGYTHYFGFLTPAVLAAHAVLYRRDYRVPAWWWVSGALLGAVLYTPWLLSGVLSRLAESDRHFDTARLSSMSAKWFSLFSSMNWFNNGKWLGVRNQSPPWLIALGALLFTLPALGALRSLLKHPVPSGVQGSDRASLVLVNALWVAPLVAIVLVGWLGVQFHIRYLIFVVAPYYIAVSKGLVEIQPRWLKHLWIVLALVHSGVGLRAAYSIPYKEDFRSVVALIAEQRRPGDCAVLLPARRWGERAQFWHVYQRGIEPPRLVNAGAADWGTSGCGRVWLVWDQMSWTNLDRDSSASVKQRLEDSLERTGGAHYYQVEVCLYEPKR